MAKDDKKDKRDRARLFIKDVLSKIPEDKRPTEDAFTEEALDAIGEGVLRQSDYSRAMDAARAESERGKALYEGNVRWRAEQGIKFEEAVARAEKLERANARLRAHLADPNVPLSDDDSFVDPTNPARPPGKNYISKEEAENYWANERRVLEEQGISIMSQLSKLSSRHLKDFDEVLDSDELIKFATEKRLSIDRAYTEFTADRVRALESERHKKEVEDARKSAREETLDELRRTNPHLPHVVSNSEPSVRDQLKADRKDFGVRAALDEYYRSNTPPSA